MSDKTRIKRAIKLYPFYEAATGDLLFFSVIEIIFFIQVKGFSPSDIALLLLVTDIADLALEYPTYKLIRRIGNSISCVIGSILPLAGILFITIGPSLPWVIAGNVLFVGAANFQSMAAAGARNNLLLIGEKDSFAKLFSRGNAIYSVLSMTSAVLIPFLFSLNRYIPSAICFLFYLVVTALSFLISDYSERGADITASHKKDESLVRIGTGLRLLILVFCLFFCAGTIFSNNAEIFLENLLGERLSEQNTIYIYGAVLWVARLVRLGSNILLPRILDRLKERIVLIAAFILMMAALIIGFGGLFCRDTILPIILVGISYVMVKGILWDPLRTFLRMAAVDTNSRKRQQTVLVLLNVGQSVVQILMDLVVVGILKILSLEYVFLVFAAISGVTVVLSFFLTREMRRKTEIMNYETTLNAEEVDRISETVYRELKTAGMDPKDALSCRLLTNEKLEACMKEEKGEEQVRIRITTGLGDHHISLMVGNEERDIFALPEDDDPVTGRIFRNVMKNM